ncbi:MAG: hypothetical protein R3A45_03910 [Bdellovibrionota bacterium]
MVKKFSVASIILSTFMFARTAHATVDMDQLINAVKQGDTVKVKTLLEDPSITVDYHSSFDGKVKETPLTVSIEVGSREIFHLLLDAGANPLYKIGVPGKMTIDGLSEDEKGRYFWEQDFTSFM